jgi:hypothetical protein
MFNIMMKKIKLYLIYKKLFIRYQKIKILDNYLQHKIVTLMINRLQSKKLKPFKIDNLFKTMS